MSIPERSSGTINRQTVLVVFSLLGFGLVNVVRLLLWGGKPLWGLLILPPILLFTIFGWLAFKTDPAQERAG